MNRMLASTFSLSAAVLALIGGASAQTPLTAAPVLPSAAIIVRVGFQDADTLYNQGVDAYTKGDIAGAVAKFQAAIAKRPAFTDAHFNLGISLADSGKPEEAIKEFTWVITKTPPAPKGKLADSYHLRGRAYVALKQSDKALADFKQALTVKPDLTEVLLDEAAAYYIGQQYDAAITDYTKYVTANPKADPGIYNNRGLAYLAKSSSSKAEADLRAAIADFDKFVTADPAKNFDGYLNRGDAYAGLKAYDKAIADYTAYLAKKPNDAYALGARARANMEMKKYPDAVKDYTSLTSAAPNDVNARINLGIAQGLAGDSAAAIATFNRVVGNPPKASDKVALSARAQAYVNMQDWTNAVKDYDLLVKLDPKESTAYFNRAVANTKLKNYDKAAADFQAYLQTNPKEPAKAHLGLGTAYMEMKKYPEAVDAFSKYIALDPKDATGLYNRGAAYYNVWNGAGASAKKDPATKGIADLTAYLKTAPTDKKVVADANKLIAEMALDGGYDPKKALDDAIAANPKDPDPLVNRGVYFMKMNPPAYDKAIADFTAAAAISPKDATVLYNRAIAYVGKKDWKNVIADTNAALAIKPDYTDALVTRGDANYNTKTYAAAIADYKQFAALSKDPKDKAYGLSQLANASAANKDFQSAVDAMTQYIAAAPTEPNGLRLRGGYYLTLKKYDEAIKDITDFLAKPPVAGAKPEDVTASKAAGYFIRGVAYVNKEEFEKGGADFEQALATKPDPDYAKQGAQAYGKLAAKTLDADPMKAAGHYAKAIALYDKEIAARGAKPTRDLADAYFNKGVMLEAKYKADESAENLKQAVEAYAKYLEVGKMATPPITDAADVQKQIDALKAKIAEL
ncbi:MAG: tetratricopeptide repeat protein [Capsulimonadales bacterium]|nr:tetratricopeptide repeat protein [Capsulimonadales bacterium]